MDKGSHFKRLQRKKAPQCNLLVVWSQECKDLCSMHDGINDLLELGNELKSY